MVMYTTTINMCHVSRVRTANKQFNIACMYCMLWVSYDMNSIFYVLWPLWNSRNPVWSVKTRKCPLWYDHVKYYNQIFLDCRDIANYVNIRRNRMPIETECIRRGAHVSAKKMSSAAEFEPASDYPTGN